MTSPDAPIPITGIAHVGIRVHDLARSLAFYELLGFRKTLGPIGPEPVAILEHPSGVEINLVLNAPTKQTPNVLMDVPVKAPGITHLSLACPDIAVAARKLQQAGFRLSEGPVRFPNGSQAIFVRDPDGVVLELNQAV
ncbi:MAG: VOC family protein [Burkholderiales bacterium]